MSVTIHRWDDPASWNHFVSQTPHAHFQQSWEWGELAPSLGVEAVRLAALHSDRMVGAMQLFISPIQGLPLTHLYVPRGPAVCTPSLSVLGPLMDQARWLGFERNALAIKIEPNAPVGDARWEDDLQSLGFHAVYPPTQPRSSWLLDLSQDEDQLLGGMKQKTRYNIRLARKKGVEVAPGTLEDLDTFYALYRLTAERDDFFIQPKEVYRQMFTLFEGQGGFRLLLARYEGKVIAAVTLLRFGSTCWYVHGASSNEHRNVMAPYLLQWEAICWAKEQSCTLYDFRAVPDVLREDQDMYGVYRFKEGFGGYHYTTMHTYALPYRPGLFSFFQAYISGRFALQEWQRRRQGLPARQFG